MNDKCFHNKEIIIENGGGSEGVVLELVAI